MNNKEQSYDEIARIRINGTEYVDFDGLSLQLGASQLATRARFRIANEAQDDEELDVPPILEGDDVVVSLHASPNDSTGTTFFEGIVLGIAADFSGSLTIECATRLYFLEKCSYKSKDKLDEKIFNNVWATDLIALLIKPYGLSIVTEYKKHQLQVVKGYNTSYDENVRHPESREYASNVRLTSYTVGFTDTIEQTVRDICNKIGVIPLDDGKGGLMLVDKHHLQTTTVLQAGVNVTGGSYRSSSENVFTNYHVISKSKVEVGKKNTEETFIYQDVESINTRHYKNKTVVVNACDEDECRLCGSTYHKRDMINAIQFSLNTPGWLNDDKVLWFPNMVVHAKIRQWFVNGMYVINGVTLNYANSGYYTTLDLKPDTVLAYDDPATYDRRPIEDDNPMAYHTAQKRKKKRKKRRSKKPALTSAQIAGMDLEEMAEYMDD